MHWSFDAEAAGIRKEIESVDETTRLTVQDIRQEPPHALLHSSSLLQDLQLDARGWHLRCRGTTDVMAPQLQGKETTGCCIK